MVLESNRRSSSIAQRGIGERPLPIEGEEPGLVLLDDIGLVRATPAGEDALVQAVALPGLWEVADAGLVAV